MAWINIPQLNKKCEEFILTNPQIKLSKYVCKKSNFIFYREYINIQNVTNVVADIRVCLVKNEKGIEGWSVDYKRHTGKWENLPIFGDFDQCLNEIKSGKWEVLDLFQ
jgi:hypothetical protein